MLSPCADPVSEEVTRLRCNINRRNNLFVNSVKPVLDSARFVPNTFSVMPERSRQHIIPDFRPWAAASRVHVHVVFVFLIGALSAVFAPNQELSAQDWEKIWVTSQQNDLSGYLVHPSLAIDSAQVLHVVFTESDGLDENRSPAIHDTKIRYSNSIGGKFSAPELMTYGPGTMYTSLSIDSTNRLHAINTLAPQNGISCIGYISDEPEGWEQQGTGNCGVSNQTIPATCSGLDGMLHVVYEEDNTIFYKTRSPEGIWSDPVNLSVTEDQDKTPAVGIGPDGTVHVVFNRWNSSDRRSLMYTSGKGGIFTTPQTLRVMSGVTPDSRFAHAFPSFVPSLTIDAGGVCHITFISIFGTDPSAGQILYVNNASGDWSEVESISGIGSYNRISMISGPNGKLHIAAERLDPVGEDWDIVYMTGSPGDWQAEVDLTNNAVDDFAPANGGTFLQARESGLAIVYETAEQDPDSQNTSAANHIAVLTKGLTPQATLQISSDNIDFGTIKAGQCKDTVLILNNVGGDQLIYSALPALAGGDTFFSLPRNDEFSLESANVDTVHIRFCPTDTGCFTTTLKISSNGGNYTVELNGCALPGDPVPHTMWIDSTGGRVGDPLSLAAQISPEPTPSERIDSFKVQLRYNAQALYFLRIEGEGIYHMERTRPGLVTITGKFSSRLESSSLFTINLEGLVTGKPENTVNVENLELYGRIGETATSDGFVWLEGCDVGTGVGFASGKVVRIKSVVPSPVVDHATINWNAPSGYSPTLQIIDARGIVVASHSLPEGTGEEQQVELQTGELQPGWYMLQIIDRAERHTLPLLITE